MLRHANIPPPALLEEFLQREMIMPVPSTNFEFLRPKWNYLADFAGYAEQYVHSDPASALVKLRAFAEGMVAFLYQQHRLAKPVPQANLMDMLQGLPFKSAVPEVIRLKLDALRQKGNKAAHAEANAEVTHPRTALWILEETHALAAWLAMRYEGLSKETIPAYQEPTRPEARVDAKLRRQREEFERLLAAKEAEYQALLDQLAQTQQVAASEDELQQAAAAGQQVASALGFSELETRRRWVDEDLARAGWKVGPHGATTQEVGQEVKVADQPNPTGIGYCDYVLYDAESELPLAVVEVKKASKSPNDGLAQAKLYADALEKQHKQRPLIFTSNGFTMQVWNDAMGEPPRAVFGFYDTDALRYAITQRTLAKPLKTIAPNPDIAGRPYQLEAVRRVLDTFTNQRRGALVVLATGTGKTRVAVSICDALLRTNQARRILFLCDRKELRKQAVQAFQTYLPQASRVVVRAGTHHERDHRIYFATYPAMRDLYETFNAGFFDLIVADESHRSLYGHYKEIFDYFDARRLGLTATPRDIVSHQTYKFFGCDSGNPTAYYGYPEAISDVPPSLVPFSVRDIQLGFIQRGMRWATLTDKQKTQAEETLGEQAETLDFDGADVNRVIFNRDTNKKIIEALMDDGLRQAGGATVGKSIVFARSHEHAIILKQLFDALYPQYGGTFASVIDNYEPRAEALLESFKDPAQQPTIAISVDMLDTGVDVPEVVNLVFAKPVKSYVKFWQMVGRGTRLRSDLFGPGQHKTHFRIFDFWGNCAHFLENEAQAEPEAAPPKSIQQQVFEARIQCAETALQRQDMPAFTQAVALLRADLVDLPQRSVPVRQRHQSLHAALAPQVLEKFSAQTRAVLRTDLAPLMRWRPNADRIEALRWDLLITQAQEAKLASRAAFAGHRDNAIAWLSRLQANLTPVLALLPLIKQAQEPSYWANADWAALESLRDRLRGIIHLVQEDGTTAYPAWQTDIEDHVLEVRELDGGIPIYGMAAYKARVQQAIEPLVQRDPALRKIRQGQTPTAAEIEALVSLVLTQDASLDLHQLENYFPATAGNLALALRHLVGLDPQAVAGQINQFIQAHPGLGAVQLRFLDLLKQRIVQDKGVALGDLYEAPFTQFAHDGLDGVFNDGQARDLCHILQPYLIKQP